MFSGDTLPLTMIVLAVLQAGVALALLFLWSRKRSNAPVVARSDSSVDDSDVPVVADRDDLTWSDRLQSAAEEQTEYLYDATYLAKATVDQLVKQSTAYSAMQEQLSNAREKQNPEQVKLLEGKLQAAAPAAAALIESAKHFLAAIDATTPEVCLLELRPAGNPFAKWISCFENKRRFPQGAN